MEKYKCKITGREVFESELKFLPESKRSNYYRINENREPINSSDEDSSDFLTSAIIGVATDNALVGGLFGGSFIGGIVGDLLNDGDIF